MSTTLRLVFIMAIYVLLIVVFISNIEVNHAIDGPNFDHLKKALRPFADLHNQKEAASEVIKRLLPPEWAEKFNIQISLHQRDYGILNVNENGTVHVVAASGVMATWTIYKYLQDYVNAHISWDHRQLKWESLPIVSNFSLEPTDIVRFYQNPCLYGYSFAFWSWQPEWSNHLDWMAINGINLALASSGQELIWRRTYQSLGLSPETVDKTFFSGKAFLPWNRMGNIKAWAGPLSLSEMQSEAELQKKILHRMTSLGMTPVVPAFNGIVPAELMTIFPNETYFPLRRWGHKPFHKKYSGLHYVMPDSKLFGLIQKRFHDYYTEEYGSVSHFYSFDTFNEMSPPSGDESFLRDYGVHVIQRLKDVDAKAIWVMQGWMFRNDTFWTLGRSKALLEAIDRDHVLILDLASTTDPQYSRLQSYFGRPFIYCMIHNYGGTTGLYGKSEVVSQEPYLARKLYPNLVGMGLTPEGIHNSYVMYELMMETFVRNEPFEKDDLRLWFANFTHRRYGSSEVPHLEDAWQTLGASVYNCCQALDPSPKPFRYHGKTTFTTLPRISHKTLGSPKWYNVQKLMRSWDAFVAASSAPVTSRSATFQYDLVEVTREVLDFILDFHYGRIMKAYFKNDTVDFQSNVTAFLECSNDLEVLLTTEKQFMLGTFLERAKLSSQQSSSSIRKYEFMARNLVTLWGPEGNVLDYARRTWSGLVKDYYEPRWRLFFRWLQKSMTSGKKFPTRRFDKKFMTTIGWPFTVSRKTYPTEPRSDAVKVVDAIHRRYRRRL